VRRGELWWIAWPDLEQPHVGVLVSRASSYEQRRKATIALVTTTRRGRPFEVAVGEANGLDNQSVINCDELVTVRLGLLVEYVGTLDADQVRSLDAALRYCLGL
jgi:mRNA interferase MazF